MPAEPDVEGLGYLGRLLLEDVCSDIVRHLLSDGDPSRFGAVTIDREWALGPSGHFADVRVQPPHSPAYFLEVKYGYDSAGLLQHMRRKYGELPPGHPQPVRLVLVVNPEEHRDWPGLEAAIRQALHPRVEVELWDGPRLRELVRQCFGQEISSFDPEHLVSVREQIDRGKERIAFGSDAPSNYGEAIVRHSLLWHFGTWRPAELRHLRGCVEPRLLVPPGGYERVVVVMADLCGFSRYVRDTPDDATVRMVLTNFYAKSRYQVINGGGMLDQFVGDQIIALFGIPDQRPGYVQAAARTACRLLDIGASVSDAWQRRIDHVQPLSGVHISMAMGNVQLVPMRPMDHAHMAVIGDCLDICARLQPLAQSHEIVVSNVLRHELQGAGYEFECLEPFDARNIGTLRPWRMVPGTRADHGE